MSHAEHPGPIRREEAIANAARVFRGICDEINDANARGGPEAIAEALWTPQHEMSKDEIAAHYERLIERQAACQDHAPRGRRV